METEHCIFHIDIDAFFASVEKLRNPRLAERPVAVGGGVIASCSYDARRFGLYAGMPLREARKRCPGLVILEGHYPIYRCYAEHVFDLCREYAPAIETHLDGALCDLSGTEKLYALLQRSDEASALLRVAAELTERVRREVGLSVSLGMGRNRMLAKMASKSAKPGGLRRVGREEEAGFMRPLPIRLLPGVGMRTEEVLHKLNIETIEEMQALPRDSLKAMFGQNGVLLYERCRGEDTRVISSREIPRSISRETSFHEDTTSSDEIEGMLYYLTERAANTLRKLGLKVRTVEVKLRYADFKESAGGKTLRTPTQIDDEIFEVALALRRSLHSRRVGLRLIGVTLSKFVPDDGARPLELCFPPPSPPRGRSALSSPDEDDLLAAVVQAAGRRKRSLSLCRSLDDIRERFGYSSVVCGKSLNLLGKLPQDSYGYILRTPSLTK